MLLHWVCGWHNQDPVGEKIMEILCAKAEASGKIDSLLNGKDADGRTPLHWACSYRAHMVAAVMKRYPIKTNLFDNEGRPAMNPYTCIGARQVAAAIGVAMPVPDTFAHDAEGILLSEECEKHKAWYYDASFPPCRAALGNGKGRPGEALILPPGCEEIEWRRAADLEPRPICVVGEFGFLGDKIQPPDVGPADIFALSVMQTMFGDDVGHMFKEQDFTKTGYYSLEIPLGPEGENKVLVEIDDYVPCIEGESCYVALGPGRGLWPVLLRKALAKLWGGYGAMPSEPYIKGEPTPMYRFPRPDEKRGVVRAQLECLATLFGSDVNPIELPSEATLNKAAANASLPMKSYLESNPLRPTWHQWLPNNEVLMVHPAAACVTVTKANEEDNHFVVVLMRGRAPYEGVPDPAAEEPTGEECPPWGRCTEWELADYFQSHKVLPKDKDKPPTKDFALEEGVPYALAAFEADSTSGLWGVRPGEWRWITVQIV